MKIPGMIMARGGSVRLPRKNVKIMCGRPLIAWTIMAMTRAKLIDDVFMITDDDEIAEIAVDYGANIIRQPTCQCNYGEFGGPVASVWEWQCMEEMGYEYEIYADSLPVSVFKTDKDFDGAIQLMLDYRPQAVKSVVSLQGYSLGKEYPLDMNIKWIQWIGDWKYSKNYLSNDEFGITDKAIQKKYKMGGLMKDGKMKPEVADGTADLTRPEYGLHHGNLPLVLPWVMPAWTMIRGIDTQEDWDTVEAVFKIHKKELFGE